MLPHKPYVLPEVDLSGDEGDPRWHESGGQQTSAVMKDGKIVHYRWNGLPPGHHKEYWRLCIVDHWASLVAKFESDPYDVHAAYWYIDNHPVFWQFGEKWGENDLPDNHISFLDHEGAMTRGWPEVTPHIDDNGLFWAYEFGARMLYPDENGWRGSFHDWKLDGTAATYEIAVIDIAGKIHEHYGNSREVVDRK